MPDDSSTEETRNIQATASARDADILKKAMSSSVVSSCIFACDWLFMDNYEQSIIAQADFDHQGNRKSVKYLTVAAQFLERTVKAQAADSVLQERLLAEQQKEKLKGTVFAKFSAANHSNATLFKQAIGGSSNAKVIIGGLKEDEIAEIANNPNGEATKNLRDAIVASSTSGGIRESIQASSHVMASVQASQDSIEGVVKLLRNTIRDKIFGVKEHKREFLELFGLERVELANPDQAAYIIAKTFITNYPDWLSMMFMIQRHPVSGKLVAFNLSPQWRSNNHVPPDLLRTCGPKLEACFKGQGILYHHTTGPTVSDDKEAPAAAQNIVPSSSNSTDDRLSNDIIMLHTSKFAHGQKKARSLLEDLAEDVIMDDGGDHVVESSPTGSSSRSHQPQLPTATNAPAVAQEDNSSILSNNNNHHTADDVDSSNIIVGSNSRDYHPVGAALHQHAEHFLMPPPAKKVKILHSQIENKIPKETYVQILPNAASSSSTTSDDVYDLADIQANAFGQGLNIVLQEDVHVDGVLVATKDDVVKSTKLHPCGTAVYCWIHGSSQLLALSYKKFKVDESAFVNEDEWQDMIIDTERQI